jgi:parallel beta-helix repeat protein
MTRKEILMRSHSFLFLTSSLCRLSSVVAAELRRLGKRFLLPILSPAILVLALVTASAQAASILVDCGAGGRIQTAVDAARPGDTILVRGVCAENVRINDEVTRITLDGQGSATIHSPSPTSNTILIRGRGVTIQGFTITGGLNGIAVLLGGTPLIQRNAIQENSDNGINVAQHSFARIVNNTIQLNHAAGIRVLENSYARIGFLTYEDTAPSGNVIRKNGAAGGVLVQRSAGASLAGNSISDNDGPGVSVSGGSNADLAGNRIDGNGSDGVTVTTNSTVQFGDQPGILNPPNLTEVSENAGFGVGCSLNSSVGGRQGSLTGVQGPNRFDRSSTNTLDRTPWYD